MITIVKNNIEKRTMLVVQFNQQTIRNLNETNVVVGYLDSDGSVKRVASYVFDPDVQLNGAKSIDMVQYYYASDMLITLSKEIDRSTDSAVVSDDSIAQSGQEIGFSFYKNLTTSIYKLHASKKIDNKTKIRTIVKLLKLVAETEFNPFLLAWVKNFANSLPLSLDDNKRVVNAVEKTISNIIPVEISLLPENSYFVHLIKEKKIMPHNLIRTFSDDFIIYLRDSIMDILKDLHHSYVIIPHILLNGCCDDEDLYYIMCLNAIYANSLRLSAGTIIKNYNDTHVDSDTYEAFLRDYIKEVKDSKKPYYLYKGIPRIPRHISRVYADGSCSVEDYNMESIFSKYIDDQMTDFVPLYKNFLINMRLLQEEKSI